MLSRTAWSSLAIAAVVVVLAGCEDDEGPTRDGSVPPEVDAGGEACPSWTHDLTIGVSGLLADPVALAMDPAAPAPEGDAGDDSDGGAVVSGAQPTARVIDAEDVPPFKGFNHWVIELQDAAGATLDDYQITHICNFMPQHNHGAIPDVAEGDAPGQFVIDRLNLAMTGGWEVRLWVDPISAGKPAFDGRQGELGPCDPPDEPRLEDMAFRVCVPKR